MIGTNRVLALIPARLGSKRLPGKHLRLFQGKPLISYTFESAKRSALIDETAVSTDDLEILELARNFEVNHLIRRPSHLAGDEVQTMEVVLHTLESCPGFDIIVLLQPTSPLRVQDDIDACLKRMIESDAPAIVSVSEPEKTPLWLMGLKPNGTIEPLVKDLKYPTYLINGAIYAAKVDWLLKSRNFRSPETLGYVMPRERSCDIDTELDFFMGECIAKRSLAEPVP